MKKQAEFEKGLYACFLSGVQHQDLGSLDENVPVLVSVRNGYPRNLGNKSQAFGGGFIIIPISKLALRVCVVMMLNSVSYLCRKDVFLAALQLQGCVGGSREWQVRTLKLGYSPPLPRSKGAEVDSWWLYYECLC